MKTHGYIIVISFLVLVIAIINLPGVYSGVWIAAAILSAFIVIITFTLGIFSMELDQKNALNSSTEKARSFEEQSIISQAQEEYIATIDAAKRPPKL